MQRIFKRRCELCGADFQSTGARAKYCTACRYGEPYRQLERERKRASDRQIREEKRRTRTKKKTAAERAAEIREINETARSCGMSYGQYTAPAVTVTIPEGLRKNAQANGA